MRHRVHVRKLSRSTPHRLAMYRNLVTSLLQHEQVETTDAKAKEVRRLADRMITLGKRGDLHSRRRALRVIRSRDVAAKVFGELADRFRDRQGGYTRVMKTRYRIGDAAQMSLVALLTPEEGAAAAPEKPAARKRAAAGAGASAAPAKAAKAAGKKVAAKKPAARQSGEKKKGKGGVAAGAKVKAAPRAKAKPTRSKKGT
jgi:large subunit ribosomal protein L17